jgi:hypothetical protein
MLLFSVWLLAGCAAYKQLKPDPKLTALEAGYIPLKAGDKNFQLDKDKKYYIEFPAAQETNFYLALDINSKIVLSSYLTDVFDDGKGKSAPIADESAQTEKMSVFPIDNSVQKYFWVIDLVRQDFDLKMDYRYVPRWRFKFENKYAGFQETFQGNKTERMPYDSLGVSYHFNNFDFGREISAVEGRTAVLNELLRQLKEIESIFPQAIINSADEAYSNWLTLKTSTEDELKFQSNYLLTLRFFKDEAETRGNTALFLEKTPQFNEFFAQRNRLLSNAFGEARDALSRRLPEVVPYYEGVWSAKKDATRLESMIGELEKLYPAAGLPIPTDFTQMAAFAALFNQKVDAVWHGKEQVKALSDEVGNFGKTPSNLYFSDVLSRTAHIQHGLPVIAESQFGKYHSYACIRALIRENELLHQRLDALIAQYRQADQLVPQLNALREQKNYSALLRLIRQNKDLEFLKDMYKSMDQLSLNEQASSIRQALRNNNWGLSEQGLRRLHLDNNFLNTDLYLPLKRQMVTHLEDSLFTLVDSRSRERVERFVAANIGTLRDVEKLYADSAFTPLYQLTFTSRSQGEIDRKMQLLNTHLRQLRNVEFPSQAIKQLYTEFTQNPDDQGVLKARAIVTHGKHYKGDDQKIKSRVAECDPTRAKWITKAMDYRKIYALPTTSSKGGTNEYLIKLDIQIPSEAQFPVFDVNVKLPQDLARNASSVQWYETIALNKEPIKNEGRFTITAPTAENNYECQITPLRMFKDKDNILEIRFRHASFKVFEVSVMAQKPIIKKN